MGSSGCASSAILAAWWDAFGQQLAPFALQEIADGYPEARLALATAAEVAGRMVGLPSERLLDQRPAFDRRSRAAARLANWNLAGSLGEKTTTYHLVDLLLSPPGERAAAVRRQLFRDPRPDGTGARAGALRWGVRPPTRIARSVLGLWRVRGGRTFSPEVARLATDLPLDLHEPVEGRGAAR